MTLEVSDKLKGLVTSLGESVMSLKDEADSPKAVQSIDDLVFKLTSNIREEAAKCIGKNDFEQATKLYYVLSELLSKCAEHAKGTSFFYLLSNNAISWSGYARSTAYTAINYYLEKALQAESEGDYQDEEKDNWDEARKKYKESTEQKNRAKTLEFNIENGKIKAEANHFVTPLLSKIRSSVSQSNHTLSPDQINIVNGFKKSKTRENWYDWHVYVENERSVLDQIEYIHYVLHPTFLTTDYEMKNRAEKFRLDASGWGEFEIKVNIHLKEGKKIITKFHWLELRADSKDKKQISTRKRRE